MAQFEQLMAANKRNSVLLVILFILFICVLGAVLGWALLGDWRAAIPSIFLALVATVITVAVMEYARRTKHKSQEPGEPPGPGTP